MRDIFAPGEVFIRVHGRDPMRMRESFVGFAGLPEQSLSTLAMRDPENATLQGVFSFTNPYGDVMTLVNVLTPALEDGRVGLVTVALDATLNVIGLETTAISPTTEANAPDIAVRQGISTAAQGYATPLAMVHERGLLAYAADRHRTMTVSGDQMAQDAARIVQMGQQALDEAQSYYREVTDDAYWGENGRGTAEYMESLSQDSVRDATKALIGLAFRREDVYRTSHRQLVIADYARDRAIADHERFAALADQFQLSGIKIIQPGEIPARNGRGVRRDFEWTLLPVEPLSEITIEEVSEALQRASMYEVVETLER